MNERFKLPDDALEGVAGGLDFKNGQVKKVTQSIDMICPLCGGTVHQVFYADGSAKYKRCNNLRDGKPCGNPLGEG